MSDAEAEDTGAPGWDAIDAALGGLYGDREPDRHYGTIVKFALGGDDPLDGLSAWKVGGDDPPHWHIVSYGMTELYRKESGDPEESGWGFELTMRVACDPADEEPPMWALNFLQNIARYVSRSGNVFAAGHYMNINGPIAVDRDTDIRAISFARAPRLPEEVASPHGRFGFLHVFGITLDELEAMKGWSSEAVQDLIRERDPLLLTALDRKSILRDPQVAAAVEAGKTKDGSSQGGSFVGRLEWEIEGDGLHVVLGALAIADLARLLEGRTRFGRPFHLSGPAHQIWVQPHDDAFSWAIDDDDDLTLRLPTAAAEALARIPVRRGDYAFAELPGLRLTIEATEITDNAGNLLETIG
jgi:suppressor of fused-like protein